jgi:hypothetical protein
MAKTKNVSKGSKVRKTISLEEANEEIRSRLVAAITVTLMFIEAGMEFKKGSEEGKKFLTLKTKLYDEVISKHI